MMWTLSSGVLDELWVGERDTMRYGESGYVNYYFMNGDSNKSLPFA